MGYWQEDWEQDLDGLLADFCCSTGPWQPKVPSPSFLLELDAPLFDLPRRASPQPPPAAIQPKTTKHYCSYITKHLVRQIKSPSYSRIVGQILKKTGGADKLPQLLGRMQSVTGPKGFAAQLQGEEGEKRAFLQFGRWYLRHRYIRHLLREGRTEERRAYLSFKNGAMQKLIAQLL